MATTAPSGRMTAIQTLQVAQNLRIFPNMSVFDNVSVGAVGAIGQNAAQALVGARSRADAI